MHDKMKKIAYLLVSLLIALFLYIFLHESGHLSVMLSAGAEISNFSILTAHVSGFGGNYSNTSRLWLHVNGVLLPVIVSFTYMLFYKKKYNNSFYHFISYIASVIPFFGVFAWVIIPFTYMQGKAPTNDDVTKFLSYFTLKYHPLIVSAVAMLMIGVGVIMMITKGIIKNFILEVRK